MHIITKCNSLPPHGGSGLKSLVLLLVLPLVLSPSPRREWIEIIVAPHWIAVKV